MSLAANPLAGISAAAKDQDTDTLVRHRIKAAVIDAPIGGGSLTGRWYDMPDQALNVNGSGTVNGMQEIIDSPDCIGIRITKASNVRDQSGDVWLMGLPAPSPVGPATGNFSGSARPRKMVKLMLESHNTSMGRVILTGPGAGFGIPFWTDIHRRGTGSSIGVQYNPLMPGEILELVYEPAVDAAAEALYPGTWMAVAKTIQYSSRGYGFFYSSTVNAGGTPGTKFIFDNTLAGNGYQYTVEGGDVACRAYAFGDTVIFNFLITMYANGSSILWHPNDASFQMANSATMGLKDQMLLYRSVYDPAPGNNNYTYAIGKWIDIMATFGTTAGLVYPSGAVSGSTCGFRMTFPAHANGLTRVLHLFAMAPTRIATVAL